MKLNQFLCFHIWKTKTEENTRVLREWLAKNMWGIDVYHDYQYYVEHQECMKCCKKRIIEKKRLLL